MHIPRSRRYALIFLVALFGAMLAVRFAAAVVTTSVNAVVTLSLSAVTLNGGSNIVLTPNATTSVSVTATIADATCGVITGGTTTIKLYRTGVSSSTCASATTTNNLNCYFANAFTTTSTCSGGVMNTTTTFGVYFYAQATDASSSFPTDSWTGTVKFTDASSSTSTVDTAGVELLTLSALDVSTTSLSYGTVGTNSDTGNANQQVLVENVGNSTTSLKLSGTALTFSSHTLPTSSQHYAETVFTYGGSEQQLSGTATILPGYSSAPATTFPEADAGWSTLQGLTNFNNEHASVGYKGYLYTIGGVTLTSTVESAKINSSDGTIAAWSTTQSLPNSLQEMPAIAYNDFLYVLGGDVGATIGGAITSTVLFAPINSASGTVGAWTATTPLPVSLQNHTAVAYNGFMYVMGGFVNTSTPAVAFATSSVFYAPINSDGTIGAWTSTQALPSARAQHASVIDNGRVYVIGGTASSTAPVNGITSTVFYAPFNSSGTLGAWTAVQSLPVTYENEGAAIYNDNIFVVGGDANTSAQPSGATQTTLYAPVNSDGTLGAWTQMQQIPQSLEGTASVAYDGYLYTMGGVSAIGFSRSSTYMTSLDVRPTYWGVSVPVAAATGTYTGTLTFTSSFVSPSGGSSPSVIKETGIANNFGGPANTTTTVTSGHTMVALLVWAQNAGSGHVTPSSVVDSLGNHYTLIPSTLATRTVPAYDEEGIEMAYATNTIGGTDSATATWNSTEDFGVLGLLEISTGTLDVAGAAVGSSTSLSSGAVNPTKNGELGVSIGVINNVAGVLSQGSGWTFQGASPFSAGNNSWGFETQAQSTIASLAGTFGSTVSGGWGADIATFSSN